MGGIRITGGIPLEGEVRIQGSKNAALPVMAAALLNRGTTVLKGCPRIADVLLMEEVLKSLGAGTSWQGDTLEIWARNISCCQVEKSWVKECVRLLYCWEASWEGAKKRCSLFLVAV